VSLLRGLSHWENKQRGVGLWQGLASLAGVIAATASLSLPRVQGMELSAKVRRLQILPAQPFPSRCSVERGLFVGRSLAIKWDNNSMA